jgi:ankyrin repeat protein
MIFSLFGKSKTDPLVEAIDQSNKEEIFKQIQKKKDLNYVDNKTGLTPLETAINNENEEITNLLIESGADPNYGLEGPLVCAICMNNINLVNTLLAAGANVNMHSEEGVTPLMFAAMEGDIEIVKRLVESGADPNMMTNDDDTALMYAAIDGHKEIFEYLAPLTKPELVQPAEKELATEKLPLADDDTIDFVLAAGQGDTEQLKEFINKGINLDVMDDSGNTALFLASYWGKIEVVKTLIEAGADLNMQSFGDKETPLMAAVNMKQVDVIKTLLENGADINIKDVNGTNALMWAISDTDINIVNLLLSYNPDLDAVDNYGNNAYLYAVEFEKEDIAKELENKGVSTEGVKKLALFEAIKNNDVSGLKEVLKKGIDPDTISPALQTPLCEAVKAENIELTNLLIDAGADVNLRGEKEEFTPLMIAAQTGNEKLVQLLLNAGADKNIMLDDITASEIAEVNEHNNISCLINEFSKET